MSAEQLPAVVNQAIRSAYAKKGVAVLTIPDDIPRFEVKREARRTSSLFARPQILPQAADLLQAVRILEQARKPVILAGRGAREASQPLIEFAE
ncbi:pyruvate oxidase, partial [Anoxybacillus sp. LAT27]|nr:pyruvate oxidase [Anoxybacillus sp. LAT27]